MDDNEYIVPDDEKDYKEPVDFLNVFICYFRTLFNQKSNMHLFDDIDFNKTDATNRCMEFIYEHVYKFNQMEDKDKADLYEPGDLDINKCQELYVLVLDNKQNKVCKTLAPIIQYVATLDWTQIKWSIHPMKLDNN